MGETTTTQAEETGSRPRRVGEADLDELFTRANDVLERARAAALEPDREKVLRKFSLREATELLGIHSTRFYDLKDDPRANIPTGEKSTRKRLFTLAEIHALQEHLQLLPRQKLDIRSAVVVTVANFKGGVAKTFTAASLAQFLAMRGYRTLAIDLDPQGSLTTTFGLNPSLVDDWHTVLPYFYGRRIVEQDPDAAFPASLAEAVQHTYWHGLDLVAANLALYSGDFALGIRRDQEPDFQFHRPLIDAIDTIRSDYDVIVVDTPPSLSFSTSTAICAADGLVIPAPAAMMDFESARYFLKMTKEVLGAVKHSYNITKEFEFLRVLITKFQPNVPVQQKLSNWQRAIFDEFCLSEPMLHSTTVQNLGPTLQTLYEANQTAPGSRRALRRALEAANAVNNLIEEEIIGIHTRRREQAVASPSMSSAAKRDVPGRERAA